MGERPRWKRMMMGYSLSGMVVSGELGRATSQACEEIVRVRLGGRSCSGFVKSHSVQRGRSGWSHEGGG